MQNRASIKLRVLFHEIYMSLLGICFLCFVTSRDVFLILVILIFVNESGHHLFTKTKNSIEFMHRASPVPSSQEEKGYFAFNPPSWSDKSSERKNMGDKRRPDKVLSSNEGLIKLAAGNQALRREVERLEQPLDAFLDQKSISAHRAPHIPSLQHIDGHNLRIGQQMSDASMLSPLNSFGGSEITSSRATIDQSLDQSSHATPSLQQQSAHYGNSWEVAGTLEGGKTPFRLKAIASKTDGPKITMTEPFEDVDGEDGAIGDAKVDASPRTQNARASETGFGKWLARWSRTHGTSSEKIGSTFKPRRWSLITVSGVNLLQDGPCFCQVSERYSCTLHPRICHENDHEHPCNYFAKILLSDYVQIHKRITDRRTSMPIQRPKRFTTFAALRDRRWSSIVWGAFIPSGQMKVPLIERI